MKVVIIGGVAGGATAAARLRRLDEKAEIIIIERSGFISYANCGLPYYVGGVIEDKSDLTLQSPEGFWKRFRIDARVNQEVLKIDKDAKKLLILNLVSGEKYEESYDKLLLSPGAVPVKPNLPGIDSKLVFTLRTVEDTYKIKDFISKHEPQSVSIVGGGFIGLEMADNLIERGLSVNIIQKGNQLLNILDFDMASIVHAKLRQKGAHLLLNSNVTGFVEGNNGIETILECSQALKSDFVILAIGVSPESSIAKEAGLKLGIRDSIHVNNQMQTSDKDIYAVGDAISVNHTITGKESIIALAGPANKQGRIAADNIVNICSKYHGSMGSSVIKLFDITVASTGLSEKAAIASGIKCNKIIISPSSHAGYYPGSQTMTMKIVYEEDTYRLLGAQIIGPSGVDKRIDVIATAIHFKASAIDLKDLDLAYAPPYSSAKDPVNMAGFVIENVSKGIVKHYFYDDIVKLREDKNAFLLDTRTIREFQRGHAEGFVNIPVDDLRDRINEIPKGKNIYVMCQSGLRSYIACRILNGYGFNTYNFSGGYRFYESVINEKSLSQNSYPCGMDK